MEPGSGLTVCRCSPRPGLDAQSVTWFFETQKSGGVFWKGWERMCEKVHLGVAGYTPVN